MAKESNIITLKNLLSRGPMNKPFYFLAFCATLFLALLMVWLDYTELLLFSDTINVRFPLSLLFYPVIALAAEFFFHLLPLYLFLRWGSPYKSNRIEALKGPFIYVLALVEPVLQVLFDAGQLTVWATVYLGVHIYVFNIVQLLTFRFNGFWPMYLLRLVYYLIWHIIWGYLRLEIAP